MLHISDKVSKSRIDSFDKQHRATEPVAKCTGMSDTLHIRNYPYIEIRTHGSIAKVFNIIF